MDFIDIGERVVPLSELDDLPYWRNVAIHRIEAFENDQLRPGRIGFAQEPLKVGDVVVPPYLSFATGASHALDH